MTVGRQKKNFQRQKSRQHRGDGRRHSHEAPWPRNRSAEHSLCQALVPGAPRIQGPPSFSSLCRVGWKNKSRQGVGKGDLYDVQPSVAASGTGTAAPPMRLPPPGSASDAGDPESFTVWGGKEHQARWSRRQVTAAHRRWGSRHCIGAQGMVRHTGPFVPSGAGSVLSSRAVFSETSS